MTDACFVLSFRADARNLSQAFSLSAGERKLMNHFVVNVFFDLAGGLARYDLRPVPVRERTLRTAKATKV
jgi:hypothetical protein